MGFSLALLRPTGANYLRMLKPLKPATASKSMSSGPAKGDTSYYLVIQKEWWIEKAVQVTVVFGLWQVFRSLVKKQEEKKKKKKHWLKILKKKKKKKKKS